MFNKGKNMKLAIIGSRSLGDFPIDKYIPQEATEIVSGGARGIDTLARDYANRKRLKITEFLPEYDRYPGKIAPLKRNEQIANYADAAVAFWDGKSTGTVYTVKLFHKLGKKVWLVTVTRKSSVN